MVHIRMLQGLHNLDLEEEDYRFRSKEGYQNLRRHHPGKRMVHIRMLQGLQCLDLEEEDYRYECKVGYQNLRRHHPGKRMVHIHRAQVLCNYYSEELRTADIAGNLTD